MADPYSGPFEVGDGYGSAFFVILPPEPLLIQSFLTLEQARTEALRNPDRAEGEAQAAVISGVIVSTERRINEAALNTAAEAESFIVERIKKTQVRPSTGKHRLENAIKCTPIPTPLAGGGVGIAELDVLDTAADDQGRAYWRAQEWGSTHLVGKVYYGWFQPGFSAPSQAENRVHPMFETSSDGKRLLIQNPIPERAFLREGAALAEVFRQRELGNAVSLGIRELQEVVAGTHPRLKAARRVRGRR